MRKLHRIERQLVHDLTNRFRWRCGRLLPVSEGDKALRHRETTIEATGTVHARQPALHVKSSQMGLKP